MSEARCSFCGQSAAGVDALIKAPAGRDEIYICTDCVRVCAEILNGGGSEALQVTRYSKPAPAHVDGETSTKLSDAMD